MRQSESFTRRISCLWCIDDVTRRFADQRDDGEQDLKQYAAYILINDALSILLSRSSNGMHCSKPEDELQSGHTSWNICIDLDTPFNPKLLVECAIMNFKSRAFISIFKCYCNTFLTVLLMWIQFSLSYSVLNWKCCCTLLLSASDSTLDGPNHTNQPHCR